MDTLDNTPGAQEDHRSAWDRMKALKDKKIPLSDTGKATLGTAAIAIPVFENLHLPGNIGIGVSIGAIAFSFLAGDSAFKAGRWLKERLVADNTSSLPQEAGGEYPHLQEEKILGERSVGGNKQLPQSEGRSLKDASLGGTFERLSMQGNARGGASLSVHPENETLRLGMDVKKEQRFDPWINDLFGKGMIAAAVQGSGKSMLCGLIIEQVAKCGVPAFVFDHKGEYSEMGELPHVNVLRAGSNRLRSRTDCFELSADNADTFVGLVMQERYQAIVHLPSYGDGWLGRAEIVAAVTKALMRYSAHQRECGDPIIPCLVFQDEAQLYIPQDPRMLPPEARKNSDILDSLNNAYFALVSNGRSNGYTMCFATPSLTYVAKSMIKSCQVRVLMRHVEKNDLDMCEQIVNGAATRDELESMPVGTGIVFGFTPKPVVVKFDKRQSRDLSETPGIDRLRQPMSRDMDSDALAKGTTLLPETMDDLPTRQQQPSHMARSSSPRVSPELQEALRLYQEGVTSYRDLGAAMGTTKYKGEVYIRELKRRKLIN